MNFLFLFISILILNTDSPCRVTVDGKFKGALSPNKPRQLKLRAGAHRIEATPSDSREKWLKQISLAPSSVPQRVTISLQSKPDYWLDPHKQLMWTLADNGSGLSWGQATRYCRELKLNGFEDWRLPAIDELQGIFDSTPSNDAFHLRGPLKLTGWQWSATAGQQAGEGWAFDFGDGGRASVAAGDSGLNRALCVRNQP